MRNLQVMKLESRAILPIKAHGASFGYDIHNLHYTTLEKGSTDFLSTGISLEARDDRVAFVFGRMPNLFNNMLEVNQRFVGSGEEIKIEVMNRGADVVEIKPYSKLTRMIVLKCFGGEPIIVDKLDDTTRGTGGYGSTGTN